MSLIKEFEEFAVKGNVIDLAVGVIIGGAFGKIVSSVVADIIMPPIGVILGGYDFKSLSIVLKKGVNGAPDAVLTYGSFLQNVVDFLIVAVAVFMFVKAINTMKKKFEKEKSTEPAAPLQPSPEVMLLTEIRDALRNK